MAVTVLIIANDKTTTSTYAESFGKKEYTLVTAHSGRQALASAKAHTFDAIVMDISALRLDLKGLCRKLKGTSFAPLILIAPPNAKIDNAIASAGVMTKPVTSRKLVQRVRAAIDAKPPRTLSVGKLSLDLERQKLSRGSKTFALTPKEFGLLKTLMEHTGQIVTRKTLMKQVWDTEYMGDTRTLDVHIRWLREKVEDNPDKPLRLLTLRGQGYKIEKEDE